MKQPLPFTIRRIRLINFHNFVDELITVPDGGHLFLLGDNGCGKTTVLDAIHYILSAGRFMEWNSAARVTGRRDGGRRLQGVVLRYNMETGVMNKEGSVSYAALEITGRNGRPLTIGLGLSATAMDEKVNSWGVIRECSLDDIEFLVTDEHGRRPASRREFKAALGKQRGFYRDAVSYRRELADRLFGGSDSYQEICRFLSMGKAYREIAAGAADYHELFKQLLPEPHTTIFEQIIEGLRTLDSSRTILDDLEQKVDYVRSVQEMVTEISHRREAVCRYDWLLCYWHIRNNEKEQQDNQTNQHRLGRQRQESEAALHDLQGKDQQLHERLADLKARDNSGLVRQEKSCKNELEGKRARHAVLASRLHDAKKELGRVERQVKRQEKALVNLLGKVVSECGRRARNLPFSLLSLQEEADRLFRNPDPDECRQLVGKAIFEQIEQHLQNFRENIVLLEREIDQQEEGRRDLSYRLEILRKQEAPQPRRDIASCLAALQKQFVVPKPLYLGLEWRPGLPAADRDRVEETIGEEILATLIIRDGDYQQCRGLITEWPGVRISCEARSAEEIPNWLRDVFDIQQSDPVALRCLAAEMESSREPEVSAVNGRSILAFRGHERTLLAGKSRLIGAESRRLALMEEIALLEAELAGRTRDQEKRRKELDRLTARKNGLENFRAALSGQLREVRQQAREVVSCRQEAAHFRERYQLRKKLHDELQGEINDLVIRHQELSELIAKEGLAGLEQRIKRLENQWRLNREKINSESQRLGALNADLERAEARKLTLREEVKRLQGELREKAAALEGYLPEGSDIAYYVLKTKTGQQFTTISAISKKREEAAQDALRLVMELQKVKLNDLTFGAAFRFSYDEAANQVSDFRGRLLADILPEQERAVREQQELINDHTRELFTKIIMTDLMNYLRSHVSSLEEMIRRINRLLANRSFGGQRYRFRVRPLDNYRRLLEVIKKYSPFDPEADKEVRHFFEDHREDIMAAEVGAVPDELDYRNWYRYELEVSSIGDEGVVMDRTTKSIGSGGEQAVPNYLLILTIAHFLYRGKKVRLHTLLFDEAFYGIDAGRRDQILGFATDLDLQLFVASPDQDGVRREIGHSTTLFVVKDKDFNIHLRDFHWQNPEIIHQTGLFEEAKEAKPIAFGEEL
jgi:DNA repair exonuclease SbcCD ATPase subunit